MPKGLVIVESPAKAKTIEKFLGADYRVLASFGHVRALPSKQGSVDVAHDFSPKYQVLPESKKHIDAIKKELKGADSLLLATDPDREGEAIAWHLLAALGLDKKKQALPVRRVVFHEITKDAIVHAVNNPRDISLELVDAQQARAVLDYLVGFNLSPFLWKKIRYGLSAGRVQSVALRLICEREKEIKAFKEEEYWTIAAQLATAAGQGFTANLVEAEGKKLGKFDIPNQEASDRIIAVLNACEADPACAYRVEKVTRSERKRTPAPPFTTSTLQQEAARKLGFSAKKTMATAQKLYEGIDVGEGAVGLITYMRTDSVALSNQALQEAREQLAKANQELEMRVHERTASLREAIAQMEEFSYSVSHDLRAPVRAMQGYARVLAEDYGERLDHRRFAFGEIRRAHHGAKRIAMADDDEVRAAALEPCAEPRRRCSLPIGPRQRAGYLRREAAAPRELQHRGGGG